MSTMRRQSSFQAGAQPKFSGSRCASIACSQVWLGLAFGCLQSVSICIAAVRAQWWSFLRCELRAMQSRSRLLVTKWESGEQPVVPLTSAFDMCWVYSILKILHSAHVSNAPRRERRWPMSHTHISTLGQYMSHRGISRFPAWCLTSRSSFPTCSCRTELYQSNAGPPICCHQRSQSRFPDRQMHLPLHHDHLPSGLLRLVQKREHRILVR